MHPALKRLRMSPQILSHRMFPDTVSYRWSPSFLLLSEVFPALLASVLCSVFARAKRLNASFAQLNCAGSEAVCPGTIKTLRTLSALCFQDDACITICCITICDSLRRFLCEPQPRQWPQDLLQTFHLPIPPWQRREPSPLQPVQLFRRVRVGARPLPPHRQVARVSSASVASDVSVVVDVGVQDPLEVCFDFDLPQRVGCRCFHGRSRCGRFFEKRRLRFARRDRTR